MRIKVWIVLFALGWMNRSGFAQESPPSPKPIAVGGHVGLGAAVVNLGTGPTMWIGRDFVLAGPALGVDYHFNEHWSVDFEMLMLGQWLNNSVSQSFTTYIMSPGVAYNWGSVITGFSIAGRTTPAGGNIGFVLNLAKVFGSGPLVFYCELDLPFFIQGPPAANLGTVLSLTPFVQMGVGF